MYGRKENGQASEIFFNGDPEKFYHIIKEKADIKDYDKGNL